MSPVLSRLRVAGLVAILTPAVLAAADWPQWRGPARTGQASESLPERLADPVRVAWRVKAGEGFASPVVAGGRVYLFDNQGGRETLRALDPADGSEVWRADVDATFRDSQGPPGPRCTPVVDGDRVYVQSCQGELQCLATSDGRRLWGVNFNRDFGVTFVGEKGNAPGATRHGNNGSPLVDGDRLYVSVGSTNGAAVVCFEKRTGAVVWKSGSEVAAYAAPVLTPPGPGRQLVDFMADAVVGFDAASGAVRWRYPVRTAFARHVMTPVLFGSGDGLRVVVGSHQAGLIGLGPDGAAPDGVAERWKLPAAAPNFSCGIGVAGHYYGLGPAKDLVCVDPAAGRVLWTQADWTSSPADRAHAGFLWADGSRPRALSLLDDGQLVLWEPDPSGYRELGRAQVCRGNWCNPAFSDGRVYVRDGLKGPGDLLCLDLRAGE